MATGRKPGVLVLLRHGQSTWNLENLFTGWHDVPLSEHGVVEAKEGGRLMKEAGLAPGVVHTSLLVRAIKTADLALEEMGMTWIPVRRSWRLNERHYGALQGLNKKQHDPSGIHDTMDDLMLGQRLRQDTKIEARREADKG